MTALRRLNLIAFVAANVGAVVVLFFLCVALPSHRRAQANVARERVRQIDAALASYRGERRRCPATASELAANAHLAPGTFQDPWDTSIAYWCSDRGATVTSAGPDRMFNTDDDLANGR